VAIPWCVHKHTLGLLRRSRESAESGRSVEKKIKSSLNTPRNDRSGDEIASLTSFARKDNGGIKKTENCSPLLFFS